MATADPNASHVANVVAPLLVDPPDATQVAEAKKRFETKVVERFKLDVPTRKSTTTIIFLAKKERILEVLRTWETLSTEQRKGLHSWNSTYTRIVNGEAFLIHKTSIKKGSPGGLAAPEAEFDRLAVELGFEGMYDKLAVLHMRLSHGRPDAMYHIVKTIWGNVSRAIIELFVDCCPTCIKEAGRLSTRSGIKPILTRGFNRRAQMELVDISTREPREKTLACSFLLRS